MNAVYYGFSKFVVSVQHAHSYEAEFYKANTLKQAEEIAEKHAADYSATVLIHKRTYSIYREVKHYFDGRSTRYYGKVGGYTELSDLAEALRHKRDNDSYYSKFAYAAYAE